MAYTRTIRVGRKRITALGLRLGAKNLIVLKGSQGYVMCGYLDMRVADACKDVAIQVKNVATIDDVLNAPAAAVSRAAKRAGVRRGDLIRGALAVIA